VRGQEAPIEVKVERRHVPFIGVAALVLFGVIFALGVLVGRSIASASLAAPQRPAPGDLAALDAAGKAQKLPKAAQPAPEKPKAEPKPEAKEEAKAEAAKKEPAEQKEEAKAAKGEEHAKAEEPPAAPKEEKKPPPKEAAKAEKPAPKPEPKAEPPPKPARKEEARQEPPPEKRPAPKAEKRPAKPAPEVETDAAPRGSGRYTLQLGASRDRSVAEKLQARARAAGISARVIEADLGAGGTWYRVRAGSFASKDEAAKVQKDAERLLRVAPMVVPAQ
jgi:DedD protein